MQKFKAYVNTYYDFLNKDEDAISKFRNKTLKRAGCFDAFHTYYKSDPNFYFAHPFYHPQYMQFVERFNQDFNNIQLVPLDKIVPHFKQSAGFGEIVLELVDLPLRDSAEEEIEMKKIVSLPYCDCKECIESRKKIGGDFLITKTKVKRDAVIEIEGIESTLFRLDTSPNYTSKAKRHVRWIVHHMMRMLSLSELNFSTLKNEMKKGGEYKFICDVSNKSRDTVRRLSNYSDLKPGAFFGIDNIQDFNKRIGECSGNVKQTEILRISASIIKGDS